jgi:hypothetical protein
MENFLAFVLILVIAVGGFFLYVDTDTVVNEPPPTVTAPVDGQAAPAPAAPANDPAAPAVTPEPTPAPAAPAVPAPEPAAPATPAPASVITTALSVPAENIVSLPPLDAETAKAINEMMEKAKTLTAEEKIEMEKKITEMMMKAGTTPPATTTPAPAPTPPASGEPSSTAPSTGTTAPSTSTESPTPPPPPAPTPAPEPTTPAKPVIREGVFTEIDVVHKGSGKAIVYPETTDGPILRLENFVVTRGPDLSVYLSKNTDIKSSSELGESVSLGALKSSQGNQNYKLPANHAEYKSAVIWSQAFGVLFSAATLKP